MLKEKSQEIVKEAKDKGKFFSIIHKEAVALIIRETDETKATDSFVMRQKATHKSKRQAL